MTLLDDTGPPKISPAQLSFLGHVIPPCFWSAVKATSLNQILSILLSIESSVSLSFLFPLSFFSFDFTEIRECLVDLSVDFFPLFFPPAVSLKPVCLV